MSSKCSLWVGIFYLSVLPPQAASAEQRVDAALPPQVVARLGTSLFWQGDTVAVIAVSADGKLLAAAGRSRRKPSQMRICLWEAATGKQVGAIAVADDAVACLSVSPDGQFLAAGCGKLVLLWEARTGKEIKRYSLHERDVSFVQFSADGQTVFSGDLSATVHQWDRAAARRLREWKLWKDKQPQLTNGMTGEECDAFLVSPDGKTLVWQVCKYKAATNSRLAVGDRYFLRIRDLSVKDSIREVNGRPAAFGRMATAADGRLLATGFNGVWLWDTVKGRLLRSLGTDRANVTGLAISPDSQTVASSHTDDTIALWDVKTGRMRQRFVCDKMEGRADAIPRPLAFVGAGGILAIGSSSGLLLWDVKAGHEVRPSSGHRGAIRRLAFAPDERTLTTADDRAYCRWDTTTWREIGRFEQWRTAVADEETLAVSGDAARFLTQSRDGAVRLREAATRKELRRWDVDRKDCHYGIFAPDGRSAVVGDTEGATFTGVILDLTADKEQARLKLRALVAAPIYSPDGKLLAWTAEDQTVHLLNAVTGAEVRQLVDPGIPGGKRHEEEQLVFSAQGDYLSAGAADKVRVWEVGSGAEVGKIHLPRGEGAIAGLSISPDGRILATALESDSLIRLWEVASGREYRRLDGHRDTVLALTFSANGSTLVSGSRDYTALVWDLRIPSQAKKKEYTAEELASLWADLRGDNASRAVEAMRTLGDIPKQSVPFLKEHLRPVEVVPKQLIQQLIVDLDSDEFKVRENASRKLEQLAERAEPELRKTRTERPSLEVRRRIDFLLEDVQKNARARVAEQLRGVRAVASLEYAATQDARALLTSLSQGAADAPLTREAKTVLQRLANRQR